MVAFNDNFCSSSSTTSQTSITSCTTSPYTVYTTFTSTTSTSGLTSPYRDPFESPFESPHAEQHRTSTIFQAERPRKPDRYSVKDFIPVVQAMPTEQRDSRDRRDMSIRVHRPENRWPSAMRAFTRPRDRTPKKGKIDD